MSSSSTMAVELFSNKNDTVPPGTSWTLSLEVPPAPSTEGLSMSIADRRASTRDSVWGATDEVFEKSNTSLRKISSRTSSRALGRRQSMCDHSPSAASSACFFLRYCVKDQSLLVVYTSGLWHSQLYPSYWTFQVWPEMQPWSPSQVHYHLGPLPPCYCGSYRWWPRNCHFVYHSKCTLEDRECCTLYQDLREKYHATGKLSQSSCKKST